jgi:hypothetical protein
MMVQIPNSYNEFQSGQTGTYCLHLDFKYRVCAKTGQRQVVIAAWSVKANRIIFISIVVHPAIRGSLKQEFAAASVIS